jgi:hypothetical protein
MESGFSKNESGFSDALYSQRQPRMPSNCLYTGQGYTDDLLNCNNNIRIHNQLCMKLETFNILRDWFIQNTKLDSSQHVSIEEKLLIFIYISSSGRSNHATQERFNRSAQVISRLERIKSI